MVLLGFYSRVSGVFVELSQRPEERFRLDLDWISTDPRQVDEWIGFVSMKICFTVLHYHALIGLFQMFFSIYCFTWNCGLKIGF